MCAIIVHRASDRSVIRGWRPREQANDSSEQSRGSRTNRQLRKAVHARLPTRADGVRCRSRHDYLVIFLSVRYGHRHRSCDESHSIFSHLLRLHTVGDFRFVSDIACRVRSRDRKNKKNNKRK